VTLATRLPRRRRLMTPLCRGRCFRHPLWRPRRLSLPLRRRPCPLFPGRASLPLSAFALPLAVCPAWRLSAPPLCRLARCCCCPTWMILSRALSRTSALPWTACLTTADRPARRTVTQALLCLPPSRRVAWCRQTGRALFPSWAFPTPMPRDALRPALRPTLRPLSAVAAPPCLSSLPRRPRLARLAWSRPDRFPLPIRPLRVHPRCLLPHLATPPPLLASLGMPLSSRLRRRVTCGRIQMLSPLGHGLIAPL